jgi:hypothetical protein
MPRLLLIGRGSADWKIIDRLADQGDMSVMKGLIEPVNGNAPTFLHTTPRANAAETVIGRRVEQAQRFHPSQERRGP